MRAELKREFPDVRFSVKRSRGTAYGYVHVSWTDGPRERDVTAITCMYEGAGFDGMTDSSYTITHTAADSDGNPTQIKYGTRGINTSRTLSPTLANQLIAQVVAYWGGIEVVPVAVEGYAGGYKLAGLRNEWAQIRADLDRLDWHTAIHRAASGEYVREELA